MSGDTVSERKPHPLPMLHAAKLAGVAPRRCVYVGDAERDVQAAHAAGMPALVATYGYLARGRGLASLGRRWLRRAARSICSAGSSGSGPRD